MGAVVHRQVAENKFSCFLVEAEMALVVASREECGREDDIVVGMAAESGNLGRGFVGLVESNSQPRHRWVVGVGQCSVAVLGMIDDFFSNFVAGDEIEDGAWRLHCRAHAMFGARQSKSKSKSKNQKGKSKIKSKIKSKSKGKRKGTREQEPTLLLLGRPSPWMVYIVCIGELLEATCLSQLPLGCSSGFPWAGLEWKQRVTAHAALESRELRVETPVASPL